MKRNLLFIIGILALLISGGCSKSEDEKYKDILANVGDFAPRWQNEKIAVTESGDKLTIITDCFRGRALKLSFPKTVGPCSHGEGGVQLICLLPPAWEDSLACNNNHMIECPALGGGILNVTESSGHKIKGTFVFDVEDPKGGELVSIDGMFEIEY